MKTVFLILISAFLFGCASQSAADKSPNISFAQTPNVNQTVDANANKSNPIRDFNSDVDEATFKKIEARNAQFEIVPDEWKQVDFQNFTYPAEYFPQGIVMDDGKFDFEFEDDRGMVNFNKVFYFDVTGDKQTDALVILFEYHCGAGCNNSKSHHFYIFSLKNNKPQYIDLPPQNWTMLK